MKIRSIVSTLFFASLFPPLFSTAASAYVEYAAYAGVNCMSCHTGPIGGFGRKPLSMNDAGWITDKFSLSGDMQFMALYDQRPGYSDQFVLFPMEASLDATLALTPTLTMAASQDFGTLREAYGMVHNEEQTMYIRAGFFTLPYGLLIQDHTAFIKEGSVKTGERDFDEEGIGAGLFGVRYKDSGVEAGLSGTPWFLNVAVTAGVIGQESRTLPSSQGGTKRALTRRGGILTKHFCLGASMYTNDNDVADRRILRYGLFGWVSGGPFALIFEHDEGEDEAFTVSGSTQSDASYVELVYSFPFLAKRYPSYAKIRYERLDPNRSLSDNVLQRIVLSYRFQTMQYLTYEAYYEKNFEQPHEVANDDFFILAHLFF